MTTYPPLKPQAQVLHDSEDTQDSHENQDTHRYSDTQDTQAIHDSARSACVLSEAAAVDLALTKGVRRGWELNLARAVKAFTVTTGESCNAADVFSIWWEKSASLRSEFAIRELYLAKFLYAMSKVRVPWGASTIDTARRIVEKQGPAEEERFGPQMGKILRLCAVLADLCKGEFYLSFRDAAQVAGFGTPYDAVACLEHFARLGYIVLVRKGTGKKANAYRMTRTLCPPNS